jgi:hypothetical protein
MVLLFKTILKVARFHISIIAKIYYITGDKMCLLSFEINELTRLLFFSVEAEDSAACSDTNK